jgi:hypothetical protein
MLSLPYSITLTFILATLYAYIVCVFAVANSHRPRLAKKSTMVLLLLLLWLIFQSTLSLNAWYMDREAKPPHILFPIVVNLGLFALGLFTPLGRKFMDSISLKTLLWVHIVRIPVELCLYWLAEQKQVPWSVTFQGYNYDIIFGITAPIIIWLYSKQKISDKLFMVWNVLGLASVLAVFVRAAGAVPSPLQAWDFNQPNYAVLHFPFIWLPSFLVMAVIFTHMVAIRRLRKK